MNKILKAVLLLLAIGGASFGITLATLNYFDATARVPKNAPTVLPQFSFQGLDGSTFTHENLSKNRHTAMVMYSPGCDHCIVQGSEIGAHINDLQSIDVVFITNESKDQINDYATSNGLIDQANTTFIYDSKSEMHVLFKPDMVPTVLLYNGQGQLLQGWSGNVAVEELLEAMPAN